LWWPRDAAVERNDFNSGDSVVESIENEYVWSCHVWERSASSIKQQQRILTARIFFSAILHRQLMAIRILNVYRLATCAPATTP
jgi:hypothetical protein